MPTANSFKTERLFIRPTNEEDADLILELFNTPKWLTYIGDRNIHSIGNAKAYIKNKIKPQLERLGFSSFTVIRKSDHAKLGNIGLYDRQGVEGIDIGFAFLPEHEGQGYAFESASKLKQIARGKFKIQHLGAIVTADNLSSRKLLDKLGLRFSHMFTLPNDNEELMYYTDK